MELLLWFLSLCVMLAANKHSGTFHWWGMYEHQTGGCRPKPPPLHTAPFFDASLLAHYFPISFPFCSCGLRATILFFFILAAMLQLFFSAVWALHCKSVCLPVCCLVRLCLWAEAVSVRRWRCSQPLVPAAFCPAWAWEAVWPLQSDTGWLISAWWSQLSCRHLVAPACAASAASLGLSHCTMADHFPAHSWA